MKINVGSTNPLKVSVVKEVIESYVVFKNPEIKGIDVDSGVGNQPHTLEETIGGAIARAKNAFNDCDLSFGLEGGLVSIPNTKTGFMKFETCAIYDGQEVHLGMSCGFEIPQDVFECMNREKIELSEACFRVGITNHPKVGTEKGIVNILTDGRITRGDQIKQAIITAMIHLENKELYDNE